MHTEILDTLYIFRVQLRTINRIYLNLIICIQSQNCVKNKNAVYILTAVERNAVVITLNL